MASSMQLLTFVTVLCLAFSSSVSATAPYEKPTPYKTKPVIEKHVDVVVEGKVYCQSCDQYGSWSLANAEPIPSAKVSVICKNYQKQITYYRAFQTDANGFFYAKLDGFKISLNILDHPLQSCKVKLVSSPLANCSLLSNVNLGLSGAPLRFENKILRGTRYEAVIYAAGPLAFRPPHCPTY